MAKSPLMYGGDLRAMNNATLSLITNPWILDINAHSVDNLEVTVADSQAKFVHVWVKYFVARVLRS